MENQSNNNSKVIITQLLKRVLLLLLGLMWIVGLLSVASRPVVRWVNVRTSQETVENLRSLFTFFNTYQPHQYQSLATKFQEVSQTINSEHLWLWIQSDIDDALYRQLRLSAQLWVYPKTIANNPVYADTRRNQLPDDRDDCQTIEKVIILCPYSE